MYRRFRINLVGAALLKITRIGITYTHVTVERHSKLRYDKKKLYWYATGLKKPVNHFTNVTVACGCVSLLTVEEVESG